MEEKKYDVFISYSRRDYVDENNNVIPGNIVSRVKEALDNINVKYWFDESGVYSGDEFAPLIARAIKNSEVFLFISSHNSNASDWTSNEIATAHAYKKKIIPFRIDNSVFNESVILYIAKLDYIDYVKNSEKAITRMTDSITSYLNNVEEQRKHEEEKRKLEAERLKKAEEKERELSHIRKRLSDVSKELESLRSQWQVSSTLYDELKAKEAALLGKSYKQTVLKLPESVSSSKMSSSEDDYEKNNKSIFKRIADWFTNPNGKERAPWVSAIVRIIIILGYIGVGFLLLDINITRRQFVYLYYLILLLIFCFSLHHALKWRRLPTYFLVFGIISIVAIILFKGRSFEYEVPEFSSLGCFCGLIPFILATTILLGSRYRGKTYFEQTEPVFDNLRDKQFLTSLVLEGVLLTTICIPAYLMMADNYYYYDPWPTEVVEPDSTLVDEDSTAAPAEEAMEAAPVEEAPVEEPAR